MGFSLTETRIDTAALSQAMARPHSGGFVSFAGWVRDHHQGRAVSGLSYAVYPALAQSEGESILDEATQHFEIDAARCIHRTGNLAIGDCAVWVGVAAAHRDAAFAACRYIIDQVKARVPIWKHEHYADGRSAWVDCAGCHPMAPAERYSRQMAVPGFGDQTQLRLKQAHAVIIGLGALGCPVADLLASAGIGRLTLIDPDLVELSNLHRQPLYTEADCGERKVTVAAARLRERNRALDIRVRPHAYHAGNAAELLRGADIVLECTDNPACKQLLSVTARQQQVPWLIGGLYRHQGALYVAPQSAAHGLCWDCLNADTGESCQDAGVLGPVPAALGAMLAHQALLQLAQLPSPVRGAWNVLDLRNGSWDRIEPRRRRHCQCQGSAENWSIQALDPELHWLDLRTQAERAQQPLRKAEAVSREQLHEAGFLKPEHHYLLICSRGVRSDTATRELRQAGHVNVWSLDGGLSRHAQRPGDAQVASDCGCDSRRASA